MARIVHGEMAVLVLLLIPVRVWEIDEVLILSIPVTRVMSRLLVCTPMVVVTCLGATIDGWLLIWFRV